MNPGAAHEHPFCNCALRRSFPLRSLGKFRPFLGLKFFYGHYLALLKHIFALVVPFPLLIHLPKRGEGKYDQREELELGFERPHRGQTLQRGT